MGTYSPIPSERELLRQEIQEAFEHRGIPVELFLVESETKTVNKDPITVYKQPIQTNIVYDDHPKPFLKKLGWFVEEEPLPLLVFIPVLCGDDLIKVTTNAVISFVSGEEYLGSKRFVVTDVRTDSMESLCFICKTTPFRETLDMKPDEDGVQETLQENGVTDFQYLSGVSKHACPD